MSVTEDYVSIDTARKLKERGFEGQSDGFYVENEDSTNRAVYPKPTLWVALKWVRREHNYFVEVHRFNGGWCYVVIDMIDDKTLFVEDCESVEDGEDRGLNYVLDNLIQRKDEVTKEKER